MYMCTVRESQVSVVPHVAQFPRCTRHQLCNWATKEWEENFSGKIHSVCLASCEAWRYLILVSHDIVKGVAWETRSKPGWILPLWHLWLYDWHQQPKKNMFTRISVHQKHYLLVLVLLLYEQYNNKIFFFVYAVVLPTLMWFLFLRLSHYSRLVVEKAGEPLLLIWSAFSSCAHTLWISNTARCLTMKCGLLRPYKDLAPTVLLCDPTPSLSSINFCVLWLMEVVVIFSPLRALEQDRNKVCCC